MPNERVLVLEDHPELLNEMCKILTEAGYQIMSAQTGAEAVALARRTTFDLIIADVFLPDTTGIQVFQQIRVIRPEIAGIVITGHSTWELSLDALRAGFVAFLVKPVVPEELLATIVSALEQEKLKHENARLRTIVPLYELANAFMETVELKDVLNQIINAVKQETHSKVASLMLIDDDSAELRIAAAAGLDQHVIEKEKQAIGQGIAGHVAKTGEPMMVAEGLALTPEIKSAMAKPDVLSALSMPLRLRGQVIGVLNLSRMRGSEPFTQSDLEVATVFAGQAAIAIDKARLINQLKQLSQISQRLASTVDLQEAIAVILRAPIETINARGVALWLDDNAASQTQTLGLDHISERELLAKRATEGFVPERTTGWLTLPLAHGNKKIGALTVCLPSPNPLNDERRQVLETIAHVAGAVIESHRLRARESLAFRQVDRAVRADLNLKDLLDRLLSEMIGACEAEGGAILLWDNERQQLVPWVAVGQTAITQDVADQILQEPHARSLAVPDASQCVVGAPMATGTRIEGAAVLTRSSEKGVFRGSQIDLLSTLTSTAALVVRNAQLYARSEDAAIAEERTRIAREIHDGLAQDLSYLVMKISVAQKLITQGKDKELKKELTEVSDQLRRDARDVRRIIFALRPLDIETEGFVPALRKFVKEYGVVNEMEMELDIQGGFERLSPKLETALFRLTQESLNNIRKHAQAKHVRIDLRLDSQHVASLRVRDDGRGFDLKQALQAASVRGSVGLVQMRERAERAGGTFRIESAPGQGTLIEAQLPIREN